MLNLQLFLDLKEQLRRSNPLLELVHIECIGFSQFNIINSQGNTLGTARVTHTEQIFANRNEAYGRQIRDQLLSTLGLRHA